MYLAAESSVASVASACLAGLALLASVVFGLLNLRRASRGPDGAPSWTLEPGDGHEYQLVQDGTVDAKSVAVRVLPDGALRGEKDYEVFRRGQRATLMITPAFGSAEAQVVVTWINKKGKEEKWESDLPS
jgi:hypothetical protein